MNCLTGQFSIRDQVAVEPAKAILWLVFFPGLNPKNQTACSAHNSSCRENIIDFHSVLPDAHIMVFF
jgi:hypothetical protein